MSLLTPEIVKVLLVLFTATFCCFFFFFSAGQLCHPSKVSVMHTSFEPLLS